MNDDRQARVDLHGASQQHPDDSRGEHSSPLPSRARTGAMVGVVAATLILSTLAGGFVETGFGWFFDGLAGLVLGAVGLVVFTSVAWIVAAVAKRVPRSLLAVLGGAAGTSLALRFTPYVGFGLPGPLYYPGLALFIGGQAVLGTALALALRDDFETLPETTRHRVVALFLAAVLVDIGLVGWLAYPGSDPYPIEGVTGPPVDRVMDAPNPAEPGNHEVETLFYGSGNNRRRPEFGRDVDIVTEPVDASLLLKEWKGFDARMRKWYWGYGIDEAPLNGRVWSPRGEGPFPLVLIVHGNHSMQDYSDPGYAYLGELLASRGFITVSVDENLINGSWSGDFRGKEMPLRAWFLLEHLRVWREWNETEGHRFQGKVDMDNIALIGHSRGGEAVSIAAAFNRLPFFPDDANVRFDYHFSIRSLVAIAQIDRRYERRIELENVNFLALQGSYDSDESSFHGMRQYARIRFTDENFRFKTGIYIHRANHGQFNTSWGRTDSGPPGSWLLNLEPLIPGEDQRRIAQIYISAFLEATLRGRLEYVPLFRDYRAIAGWLPKGSYVSRYQDSTDRILADYEEDLDVTTSSASGGVIRGDHLVVWREQDLPFRDKSTQRNNAVYLGWRRNGSDDPSDAPSYTIQMPEEFAVQAKIGPDTRFTFSVSQADEAPTRQGDDEKKGDSRERGESKESKESKEPLDLTLELVDGRDAVVRAPLSRFAPVPKPLRVRFLKLARLNRSQYGDAWEPTLQTYEIPLSDFVALNPQFDPATLRTVRFRFDMSPRGVIVLDDLGFRSLPARHDRSE